MRGRELGALSFEEPACHDLAAKTEIAAPSNVVLARTSPADALRLLESVWSDAAWNEAILNAVGARNFTHWFRGRTSVSINTISRGAILPDSLETEEVGEGIAVTIGVSSPFFLTWMQRQFREAARTAARAVLGADVSVRFVVDESLKAVPATNGCETTIAAKSATIGKSIAKGDTRGTCSSPVEVSARPSGVLNRTVSSTNSSRSKSGPTRLGLVVPVTDAPPANVPLTRPAQGVFDSAHPETAAARRPPFAAATAISRRAPNASAGETPIASNGLTPTAASANSARSSALHPNESPASIGNGGTSPASKPAPRVTRVVASTASHNASTSSDRTRPDNGDGNRLSRKLAELSDFVAGPGNELAFTAVQQVCDAPGSRANPLFLYGGVGIGKTHLLEGICRRVRRTHPHLQVMLLSAEAFANHFTEALRQRTLPAFRQRFRNVDILLVDDVEFFEGKQVIQEEFLHTFKQLEALGRQLVVTADRHPRILTRLSDDLISRFQSGLVCRIENPDLETRRRIASMKAGRFEADFAPEAVAYVAQRFTNNVRELEGALHSLATWHAMTGRRITATAARTILADMERDCVKIVRVGDVEQAVCRFFGLAADDLRSSRRNRTLSQPRMMAMFLSRKLTQAAYSEIGQHFGGRNHSTVMSAEKKVQDWVTTGAPIRVATQSWPVSDLLESLEQQLRAS